MKFKSQIESEVATGTAPFSVASTTTVPNLSTDKWDGQDLPSLSGNGGKVLAVNTGATALEFKDAAGGSGTVTSITAGTGLTGGTITVSGTIAANIGTASGQVAAGDHTHATLYQPLNTTLNAVAAGTYTGDDSIATVGTITSGTWNGADIQVAHGGTGVSTLTSGYVLIGNGSGALTTLSRSGIDNRATFPTGTVTVANGGTGATAAAGARTNLETPKVFISATQPTATNIGDIWFIP